MLYAWVYFENRFKDMYLPSTQKWSETISVRQSETGWDQDYFISLRSLDGKCFVTPPEKFRWQGIPEEAGRELSVSEGTRYTMEFGSYIVGIVFSACSQGDTAFKKYYTRTTAKTEAISTVCSCGATLFCCDSEILSP